MSGNLSTTSHVRKADACAPLCAEKGHKQMTTEMGHNERTARLGLLADDARRGLEAVEQGEGKTLEGWLAYGAALNEGRALFPGDREFGQWVDINVHEQLVQAPEHPERQAAMWAAANPDDFEIAKASGNARTVRGIHAKWKEIVAEREAEQSRQEAEAARVEMEKARAESQKLALVEEKARQAAQEAKDEEQRRLAEERLRKQVEVREAAQLAEAEALQKQVQAQKKFKEAERRLKNPSREGEKNVHVSNNSGENEWYTPEIYIESARKVMGGIDLDPATSEVANRTVRAATYFTAQDDGLAQTWPIGRIWMNPPYAQPLIGQFAEKMAQEVERGSESVVLVNNATETAWFQRMASVCSAICFPKGRIKFLDPKGNPSGAPLQGQAIIYSGPNVDKFDDDFSKFGLVVRSV